MQLTERYDKHRLITS